MTRSLISESAFVPTGRVPACFSRARPRSGLAGSSHCFSAGNIDSSAPRATASSFWNLESGPCAMLAAVRSTGNALPMPSYAILCHSAHALHSTQSGRHPAPRTTPPTPASTSCKQRVGSAHCVLCSSARPESSVDGASGPSPTFYLISKGQGDFNYTTPRPQMPVDEIPPAPMTLG